MSNTSLFRQIWETNNRLYSLPAPVSPIICHVYTYMRAVVVAA